MRAKAFFPVLLLVPYLGAGEELTLPQALELALRGPAVQAAEAAARAEAARVDQAQAWRLPHVEFEAQARGLTRDPGFLVPRGAFGNPFPLTLVTGEREVQTGRLTVSQLLWDWRRTGLAVDAAKAQAAAAEAQARAVRQQVAQATVEAFAQAWGATGQVQAALEAQKAAGETLRVVQAMVAQGLVPKSDELAAQFLVQQREAEAARAQAALQGSLAVLAELTGVAVTGVTVGEGIFEAFGGLRMDGAVQRPELEVLRRQKEALDAAARAYRRENWPVLAAVGGIDHVRDSYYLHQTNGFGAVVLKASLFDGGQSRARVTELASQRDAVTSKLEATERAVEREMAVAEAKEKAARQALAAAEKAVAAAEEEVRLETLRHGQGLATTRDLLQAQEHLAAARAAVAQSQAALLSALAQKVAAVGEDFLAVFGGER